STSPSAQPSRPAEAATAVQRRSWPQSGSPGTCAAALMRSLQFGLDGPPHARGQVSQPGVLTQLQGADVGDDRPAVARRDLGFVVRHGAEALADHLEIIAGRRVTERNADAAVLQAARLVVDKRRRPGVAALDDLAVAAAGGPVTDGAEDGVTLLTAEQHLPRHR